MNSQLNRASILAAATSFFAGARSGKLPVGWRTVRLCRTHKFAIARRSQQRGRRGYCNRGVPIVNADLRGRLLRRERSISTIGAEIAKATVRVATPALEKYDSAPPARDSIAQSHETERSFVGELAAAGRRSGGFRPGANRHRSTSRPTVRYGGAPR